MTRSIAIVCAGAVLLGCGGESTHQQTVCKVAWQEILTPAELRPFYAGASVSHGGRVYLLAESPSSPFQSRELGIVFQRPSSATPMSDNGAPSMGISVAAVGVGTDLFFLSASDASGRFDTTAEVWSELPELPADSGTVRAAVGAEEGIFVAYNAIATGQPPEAQFVKYAAGDSDWTVAPPAPHPELRAPALVWTGREILAWGGEGEDQSPRVVGARYEPARDAWREMPTSGAPEALGGVAAWRGGWTGTVAVFWNGSTQSAGRFDPETGTWSPVSFAGEASFGQASVIEGGRVVSWTGTAITVYDPATDEWSLPAARCAPQERHSAQLAWVDDGVVLWGGTVDCTDEPDPRACTESELQRAFFLSERALYAGSSDSGDCYCPQALGAAASP